MQTSILKTQAINLSPNNMRLPHLLVVLVFLVRCDLGAVLTLPVEER